MVIFWVCKKPKPPTTEALPAFSSAHQYLGSLPILGQNVSNFNHISLPSHGMEYTLGLIDTPDELTELYGGSGQHGTTLPVELQYCFGMCQLTTSPHPSRSPINSVF